jgi:hypothetical protein
VAATQQTVADSYGALPLAFEQNIGQTDSQVAYLARAGGSILYLTTGGEAVQEVTQGCPRPAPEDLLRSASHAC